MPAGRQATTPEAAAPEALPAVPDLEAALEQESQRGLIAKAREIGVAVRGKKAQLAALIADAIRAKAGTAKRSRIERDELKATEKAIREHPVYQAMAQGAGYQEADIESGMENRTRKGRVDPDRVYYVEPRYRREVESVTGEKGEKGYDKDLAAHITFDKAKGQAWDDAVAEQQLDLDLSGFLGNLRDAVAAGRQDRAGIYDWAVQKALESGDPSLEMLVEKRRLLQAKWSPWEINQELHRIAARYELDKAVYQDILIAGGMIADPNDPHPGSLSFEDFFERLGQELADRTSPWVQQWSAPVHETARQMYARLKAEWQALAAQRITAEVTAGQLFEPGRELTPDQKAELEALDAERVASEILKSQKETIIGRLIGGLLDEAAEMRSLRAGLVKAYNAGRKEGIEKARQAYRAAQQKLRANQRLRDYIGYLLRYIKKPPGATVAMEARRAIAMLQSQIDPHLRSRRTIDTRQAAREYFASHPDVAVPPKVLERILARSPSEMTVAELEELAQQVRTLRRKGRIMHNLREAAKEQKAADDRGAFLKAIGRDNWSPGETGPILRREDEPIGRRIRDLVGLTLTPERLFDALERGKNFAGTVFRMMWDRVADGMTSELTWTKRRRDAVDAKLKSLGLTRRQLTETALILNGKELSGQEVVGIYNFTRNLMSQLAITFGNHIALKDQTRVVQFVENEAPVLKELADWMVEFYDQRYEAMRQATIEAFGADPGREENYTPMRRMELDFVPDDRQIHQELEARYHLRNAFVERGFTIRRQDIPEEHQKPVRLDSLSLLYEQIEREEHEIAFAVLVKQMNALIHDPAVKTAVFDRVGRRGWERIKNYVDAVANPNIYRTYHDLERMAQTMRGRAAIAFLAGKLSTMLLQPVSVMLYLPEAGHHLLIAGAKAVADWSAVRAFVVGKDPLLDSTVLEREFEELRDRNERFRSALGTVGEWGMNLLTAFDAVGRTIGWYGTYLHQYDAGIKAGLTEAEAEAEAVRVARHTTTRTQPGSRAFELPEMYRTSMVVNLLQQFTQQLNRMWNMTVYDMPTAVRNGNYMRAVAVFAALGINGLFTWMIQNRRVPEDDEDLAEAFSDQFISCVPFIGTAWEAYEHGFEAGGVPAVEGAAQLAASIFDMGKGLVKGEIDTKAMTKAIQGLAPILGIPWEGPRRIVKAIQTGKPIELVGKPKPKKEKLAKHHRS